jgi:UDP-N-acetylglucosamine--dolichyl-phosphate N-acetylglucosaminephosphotransferase
MLAGINGLESGMGSVALAGLGLFALVLGRTEAAVTAVVTVAALLAFAYYNWYPARILPGDSLTYLIGSVIVSTAIIGNIEKFGMVIFAPWIIEAFIKLCHGFRATSLGKLAKDGSLKPRNDRVESLTHVVMRLGNLREDRVALVFVAVEAAIVAATLGLWLLKVI